MSTIKDKIISVQQALDLIQDGYQIVTGLGAAEARLLLSNLHCISDRINRVGVTNCLPMTDFEFFKKDYSAKFFVDGWFYSPTMRKIHDSGNASFIPNNLHFASTKRLYHLKPNVYVGSCSAIDRHGYISLSTSNTYERKMIDAAHIVILEINENFPRTFGDVQLHYSKVDYFIEADYKPPVLLSSAPNEKDKKIGEIIASYINDGDCIQLGIGGIPNAVTNALKNKKDLGVHTEMLTSGMLDLVRAGVINGERKNLHPGKMVTTFILGSEELYNFSDDNPSVCVMDGTYTNDPYVIAQNNNQISINTTLEIDLTGQCASESIGSIQYSGTGGQTDTAVGAQNSKNGKSFIALYSTAMIKNKETGIKEEKSKILPQLTPGAVVSLSRNDVDYVVTEYGCVQLRGTNIKERVQLLISIAHPKFREELKYQAIKLGIIA